MVAQGWGLDWYMCIFFTNNQPDFCVIQVNIIYMFSVLQILVSPRSNELSIISTWKIYFFWLKDSSKWYNKKDILLLYILYSKNLIFEPPRETAID